MCWKDHSPKVCPAAAGGCKSLKSACTDMVKCLLVVPFWSGKNNHWHRPPVYAGQVWHYYWTSQDRRWITIRKQRGKINVSKMFEDILKMNPHLGSLLLTCHKDSEFHAWGSSQPCHCNSNTEETFTSAPNWREKCLENSGMNKFLIVFQTIT